MIDAAHTTTTKGTPAIIQYGCNTGYTMSATFQQAIHHFKHDNQMVRFQSKPAVATFQDNNKTIWQHTTQEQMATMAAKATEGKQECPSSNNQ